MYAYLMGKRTVVRDPTPEPDPEPEPEPRPEPGKFGYILMGIMGLILSK